MTKLEQIERSVADLPPEDLRRFTVWFEKLQVERWDKQFQEDVGNGALDRLADTAIADVKQGRSRTL